MNLTTVIISYCVTTLYLVESWVGLANCFTVIALVCFFAANGKSAYQNADNKCSHIC